jgi:hypothetical protein
MELIWEISLDIIATKKTQQANFTFYSPFQFIYFKGGITVKYTGGTLCEAVGVKRSTNINFICDPDAGVGMPSAPGCAKCKIEDKNISCIF